MALTGEITLRGRVLAVGGIKEKAVAAMRSGIKTVILPVANVPELELLPDEVREALEFVPAATMDEVLGRALVSPPGPRDELVRPGFVEGGTQLGTQIS